MSSNQTRSLICGPNSLADQRSDKTVQSFKNVVSSGKHSPELSSLPGRSSLAKRSSLPEHSSLQEHSTLQGHSFFLQEHSTLRNTYLLRNTALFGQQFSSGTKVPSGTHLSSGTPLSRTQLFSGTRFSSKFMVHLVDLRDEWPSESIAKWGNRGELLFTKNCDRNRRRYGAWKTTGHWRFVLRWVITGEL